MNEQTEPKPAGAVEPGVTAASPQPNPDRVVVRDRRRQDLIVGLVVGAAVLGFVLFAIFSFNKEVGGLAKPGHIIEKLFIPEPETQITVGYVGQGPNANERILEKTEIAGKYILRVKLDSNGEIYNVYVDPKTYAKYNVGQSYMVLRQEGGGRDVFEEAAAQVKAEEARK